MAYNLETLRQKVVGSAKGGAKRHGARLISMIENKIPGGIELLKELFSHGGNAYVIGVTGPPGTGKSTLTDKMAKVLRKKGKTIAVVAIDPTSPYTGGAILGDRVRMSDLATDEGVFIRSMGARGHLGGISEATVGAVRVLDIMGYDYIFIETVGVGQSEIDIVKNCDTTLMVTMPGMGDDIQSIKAGVLEIGDVFAVNKADRDGADRAARELEAMLDFSVDKEYRPPVKKVIATDSEGVDELLDSIFLHMDFMKKSGRFVQRRIDNAVFEVIEMVKERIISGMLDHSKNEASLRASAKNIVSRCTDPFTVADEIVKNSIK